MEIGENMGVNQMILEITETTKVTNAPPELSDPAMTNTLGSVLPLSLEALILRKPITLGGLRMIERIGMNHTKKDRVR